MRYEYTLTDGSKIIGDTIINQKNLTNVINVHTPRKWYQFWKRKHTNNNYGKDVLQKSTFDLTVINDSSVAYHTILDLSYDEMCDYLKSVDKALEEELNENENDNGECECNCNDDSCDDLEDGTDETPNAYFEFRKPDQIMFG